MARKKVNIDLTYILIVYGGNYRRQLEYFNYKNITRENRVFVPVPLDSVSRDISYNKYVMGYVQIDGKWGYYANRNAKFLSSQIGPALIVRKDKKRSYIGFIETTNVEKSSLVLRAYSDDKRLLLLKNYEISYVTPEEFFENECNCKIPFIIATAEFINPDYLLTEIEEPLPAYNERLSMTPPRGCAENRTRICANNMCKRKLPDDWEGIYCSDECRDTRKKVNSQYYQDHKEEIQRKQRLYQRANPDLMSEINRRYRANLDPWVKKQREIDRREYKSEWARKKREAERLKKQIDQMFILDTTPDYMGKQKSPKPKISDIIENSTVPKGPRGRKKSLNKPYPLTEPEVKQFTIKEEVENIEDLFPDEL